MKIRDEPYVFHSANPTFVPLTSIPTEVKRKIWDRVIYFVILSMQETVFEHQFSHPDDFVKPEVHHLLTVSKLFHV